MDKNNMIEAINKMPSFVLRDVAVSNNDWHKTETFQAVTESEQHEPLTFVTKKYKLVQMKQIFLPIVDSMPSFDGYLYYFKGYAYMDLFPDNAELKGSNYQVGISAINSVNKQSSVLIKFNVLYENKLLSLPENVAGFKRVHAGKVLDMSQNFLVVVNKVKDVWNVIIDNFSKTKVDESMAAIVLEEVELNTPRILPKVIKKVQETADMNLWDLFVYLIEMVEQKKYKTELHKRRNLERITEKIFKYAIVSKLITA